MKNILKHILNYDSFKICRLLTTDEFITYCKKRKMDISKRTLERLEELGIFYPIARSKHLQYQLKIRTVDEKGAYKPLGPLKESEDWDGETKEEYARFYFGHADTNQWIQEGLLWDPRINPFVKRDNALGNDGRRQMESHYSPFQTYELWWRIMPLRRKIAAEFWVSDSENWAKSIEEWANDGLELAKKHYLRYDISHICQIISNRYYPLTQTNKRYYNIATPHGWDWYKFNKKWDANEVIKRLELEPQDIRNSWDMVLSDAKHCDPMEDWYELISFTAIEKRDKLKNHALQAQTWYAMEHMLRLFYYDLTKKELPTPEGPITFKFSPDAKKPIPINPLVQLEILTNDFNINPRPVLILLVEGESEEMVFPKIVETLFGSSIQSLGIKIIPLKGIGNFDGNKRYDRHSAIVRLVDDYHSQGTIVFVVVDNEGRAEDTKQKLIEAKSIYQKRDVTREEYIVIWDKNVELDNFTDPEIAIAMSTLTDNKYKFSAEQISEVRASFRKKDAKHIEQIFEEVSGYSLNKLQLLTILIDLLSKKSRKVENAKGQNIVSVIKKVIDLARENRPQNSQWERDYLANKGLYGKIRKCPSTPCS